MGICAFWYSLEVKNEPKKDNILRSINIIFKCKMWGLILQVVQLTGTHIGEIRSNIENIYCVSFLFEVEDGGL